MGRTEVQPEWVTCDPSRMSGLTEGQQTWCLKLERQILGLKSHDCSVLLVLELKNSIFLQDLLWWVYRRSSKAVSVGAWTVVSHSKWSNMQLIQDTGGLLSDLIFSRSLVTVLQMNSPSKSFLLSSFWLTCSSAFPLASGNNRSVISEWPPMTSLAKVTLPHLLVIKSFHLFPS